MSYTLVINNKNVVGTGNNTYQYNFIQGNFTIPEDTEMMIANIQIPYSFYNITLAYGNNSLIFNWPTSSTSYISYNIIIPDGFYTTTSLSNYLQQWMISNGFYLYNSTTAQNVYYLSLVYNTYQYGNQILLSPVPTSLPSGYALPSGYTSSTIFGGFGFPTISRTPFIVLPFLKTSTASSTLGNFLGYGSYTAPTFIPAITSQNISLIASGASITANLTGAVVTSLTIVSGGNNYTNPFITFSGGGGTGARHGKPGGRSGRTPGRTGRRTEGRRNSWRRKASRRRRSSFVSGRGPAVRPRNPRRSGGGPCGYIRGRRRRRYSGPWRNMSTDRRGGSLGRFRSKSCE